MLSFLPGWLLCPIVLLFGTSYTAVISLLIFIVSCVRYPLLGAPEPPHSSSGSTIT